MKKYDVIYADPAWRYSFNKSDVEELYVKLNLPVVGKSFNASFKKGDEVYLIGEKCTIIFIDKKTGLVDIEKCNTRIIYTEVNPIHLKIKSV